MESRNLISFVPASQFKEPDPQKEICHTSDTVLNDGDEIRSFYEQLVHTKFESESDSSLCIVRTSSNDKKRKKKKISSDSREQRKVKNKNQSQTLFVCSQKDGSSMPGSSCERRNTDNYVKHKLKSDHPPSEKDMLKLHNTLLHLSQYGDIDGLCKLLKEQDFDINFQDRFGWTALMCAAVAKNVDIVKLLLENGADKQIRNCKGDTAVNLCADVFNEIDHSEYQDRKRRKVRKAVKTSYCDICKSEYSDSSDKGKHIASTIHLFNLGLKPKPDRFMISGSNVGFRLMQKSGWDGESGLGNYGQGQKYPVKTVLKRDRKCIGAEKEKAKPKVTHFGPNDADSVRSQQKTSERVMSARALSKRERRRKIAKDKKWEKDLRTYMNADWT